MEAGTLEGGIGFSELGLSTDSINVLIREGRLPCGVGAMYNSAFTF